MMKKILFLFLPIVILVTVSGGALNRTVHGEETYYLKLRAGHHPEFLRIVLEGAEPIISKGIVNQKGKDILVSFPDTIFTIKDKKGPITYKRDKDTVLFSPGEFHEFKVFSLKYPSRLVIDIYLNGEKKDVKPSVEALEKEPGIQAESGINTTVEPTYIHRIKTVIIDPGHGGYEAGITTEDYKEKNVVFDIAKRLRALINRGSARCSLTRKSDRFMSLGERVKFSNTRNAEVFLSLHVGKHNNIVLYTPVITEPASYEVKDFLVNKGQEAFIRKTAALRDAIRQAIIKDFGDDMVSTKPLPYSILSKIEAAALIIELPSFEDAYYIAEFKTELANTIYKGIYLYEENTTN